MKLKFLFLMFFAAMLAACAEKSVRPVEPLDFSSREYLYAKTAWSFTGRLALSDKNDSMTAFIDWVHQAGQDQLELVGPFGQGRMLIQLSEDEVLLDYGDKQVHSSGDVDKLVSKQVGIEIPVSSLKYWVLGLVDPGIEYDDFENGFEQSGWKVSYQQMQTVDLSALPRKIRVEQNDVKLKLIINDWDIKD